MSVVTSGPVPGVVRQDVRPAPPGVLLTGVPALLGRAGGATAPGGSTVEPADPAAVGAAVGAADADTAADGEPADVPTEAGVDPDCYVAYRLTSWPQFRTLHERVEARFGAAPGSHLADAVRGFFANGGQVAYVLWVRPADGALVGLRRGLASLDDRSEVDLVAVPDLFGPAVWPPLGGGEGIGGTELASVVACQRAVLDHCAARGDRFAVLDGVPSVKVGDVVAQRVGLAGPAAAFGALYFPWVQLDVSGTTSRFVPASGHLAGLYARTDAEVGVHRAPANAVVEGVLDVQVSVSDTELSALAAGGVNAVLALPGRGIRVWGARTAADDPAWRTVPVRRVVGTFQRWLETFMVRLAHEPNDIRLWVRIMREVSAHLEGLYQRGVLRGVVPEEAFYVKCDHETNPPSVVDAGIVVTEVGLAPAVPAEFIVVRAVQSADGVMVSAG